MAGHSQFSNIKHRKEAQDSKRAKKLTKLRREIIVAARSGLPDPNLNSRLRSAIASARKEGLPKDKIDNAIKSSKGNEHNEDYQEIRYEGYGVNGVAIIIQALTNNRNRTAAELRFIFSKHGGNLGELGNVGYLFSHIGMIIYERQYDELFEVAIENNALEIEDKDDFCQITCEVKDFSSLSDALYKKFSEPTSAHIIWKAKENLQLNEEDQEKVKKLIEALEDNDDVQYIYHNT